MTAGRMAQEVFNRTAATYDEQRARLIPGYERFYSALTDLLPSDLNRCVDLGTGTGLLAERVLQARPGAELLGIDASEPMLHLARQRMGERPGVAFLCADYTQAELPQGVDAVVSALSIHHLEDAAKQQLFGRIAQSLRPGGVFLNADQVLGPTAQLEDRYRTDWLRRVRELGASEQQIQDSLYRQEADRCATVEDQLRWMSNGFVEVDCWYKDGRFAVMYGVRG